jgi:hypothetical protein
MRTAHHARGQIMQRHPENRSVRMAQAQAKVCTRQLGNAAVCADAVTAGQTDILTDKLGAREVHHHQGWKTDRKVDMQAERQESLPACLRGASP